MRKLLLTLGALTMALEALLRLRHPYLAILYDTGSTIYVNRPRSGRESLDQWDVLVTKTFSSDLCTPDVVQLWDSGSRMQSGFVFLGEFVPYKRAPKPKRD